jgi:hypothetical protein
MRLFDLPPGSRCSICDSELTGRLARDPTGQHFCERHVAHGRQCRCCDRFFLTDNARDRDRCATCARLAVVSHSAVTAARDRVASWFSRNRLALSDKLPPITLRAALPLSPVLRDSRMLAYVERLPNGQPIQIIVECGLPAALLDGVLAHELGHVLLAPLSSMLPQWAEEGSCDWLAHCYLGTVGDPECSIQQRRIEARTDAVYGAGFQWVRARLGAAPPDALLPLLRSHWPRSVPPSPFTALTARRSA